LSTHGHNGEEPLLTHQQRDAWSDLGSQWDAIKDVWLSRGFRLPPKGSADEPRSQRAVFYEILDARPNDLRRWIQEAPGRTAYDVGRYVIRQWRDVQSAASGGSA
jgi:hypothetical protein